MKVVEGVKEDLGRLFLVSQLETKSGEKFGVTVGKAEGEKCIRCWVYRPSVGSDAKHPEICSPCVEALS